MSCRVKSFYVVKSALLLCLSFKKRYPHGFNGNETERREVRKRYREKHPEIFLEQKIRYRRKTTPR